MMVYHMLCGMFFCLQPAHFMEGSQPFAFRKNRCSYGGCPQSHLQYNPAETISWIPYLKPIQKVRFPQRDVIFQWYFPLIAVWCCTLLSGSVACRHLHPGRWTWNLKIHPWNARKIIFQTINYQVLSQSSGVYKITILIGKSPSNDPPWNFQSGVVGIL